jgi:hypothetical protein
MSMSSKPGKISRRTMLRGAGAALGLPLLEAMGPVKWVAGAFAAEKAAAKSEALIQPVRMAFLYMPNGVNPNTWTPEGAGRDFKLSPTLEPLAAVKDDLLVLTNLTNKATDTGDGHYQKTAAFLTGTCITRTTGADLRSGGVSIDQLAAQRIGHLTPLPSLELGLDPVDTGVDTNVGYTRVYGCNIAWSSPTTPVAKEINPQLAFDRLFRSSPGSKGDPARDKSVLDLVKDDAAALNKRIGHTDQLKLEEYLDAVRAVEKRIDFDRRSRTEKHMDDAAARAEIEKLGGRIKDIYSEAGRVNRGIDHTEHVRIMMDLMVLGFWTDSTRIGTFMFGNAVSGRNFSFLPGVKGGFHEISHHENNGDKLEQYRKINTWHMEQYAYMLGRLKGIKEGEKTLLDNSMILCGSGLRDGNQHNPHNVPILLAGRGGGALATGRHLVYGSDTPLCNVYVSMLNAMGVKTDRFSDSTGPLAGLGNAEWKPG